MIVVAIVITMASCGSDSSDKKSKKVKAKEDFSMYLPGINGALAEIIVVVEDKIWNSGVKDAVETVFGYPYAAIPQEEASFNIVHLTKSTFSSLLKQHRNIILTTIDKKLDYPEIDYKYDKWAKGQLIIEVKSPSSEEMADIFLKQKSKLFSTITNIERKRLAKDFSGVQNKRAKDVLKKKHGLDIVIPKVYTLLENRKDFTWMSYEPRKIQKGLMIYTSPYNPEYIKTFGKANLNKKYLMHLKDSVLKKNVPGAKPNTHMCIERHFNPHVKTVKINGREFVEMRGLWRVNGLVMGGPFVSISTIDKKRNEVITIDSYVYSPHYAKRNHVMQIESLLYTVKIK